jgi:glutamyl-tRNA reductase
MHQDLILLHAKGASLPPLGPQWALWKTCLREIAFGHKNLPFPKGKYEVFTGEEAYRFILEVVCGLRSPLIGETEVMGQFKEFLSKKEHSSGLQKMLQAILVDAKSVRHNHLSKLGSQSYGSLCRKHLHKIEEVHILGSGQLAEELLPWLSEQKKVFIRCRKPETVSRLEREFGNVSVESLEGPFLAPKSAIIVAAPLTSSEILAWVGPSRISMLLDLRGESKTDPVRTPQTVEKSVSLKDFYQSLENHQSHIQEKVEAARQDIQRLCNEKSRAAELRPFGWDDLCA